MRRRKVGKNPIRSTAIKQLKTEYSISILRKRLLAISLAVTFLFCFLFFRFFYVQVVWSEELGYRALDQWTREIPIIPRRGKITDRNGVVLADNSTAYTVFARSNAVRDKESTAALLAQALELDSKTVYERLTKKKASEVTIAKKVKKNKIETLSELLLDGVYYSRDNVRYYPKGDALCQVVGFTSTDNVGTTGVEKYYDEYLAGKKGELLYETDLVGVEIENSVAAYLPAEDGYNVELTIDYGIQELAESAMERVCAESSPKSASCIVLDVNTFEVLALANYPSYDLNEVPRNDAELLPMSSRLRDGCYSSWTMVTAIHISPISASPKGPYLSTTV